MMRTVLGKSPRPGVAWLLAMVMCVAVLAAVPGVLAAADKEETKKALPADLALVPHEALGLVSIRVADLWKDQGIKDLHAQILKDAPAQAQAIAKEITDWLPQIDRLTFVLLPVPGRERTPRMAAIVLTTEPYDQKKILAYRPGAKEEKSNGKTYFADAGVVAFYPVDKNTFVVGEPDGVVAVMAQEGKEDHGPLAPALAEAATKHHVVIGLRPAPFFTMADLDLPPEAKPFTDLIQPEVAVISEEFGKEIKYEVRLTYANAQEAEDAATVARAGAVLARRGLPVLRAQLDKANIKEPALTKVLDELGPALKAAAIKAKGNDVTIALTVKVDMHALGLALAESVVKVREAASRLTSSNNLKQMTLATINMADTNGGVMPADAIYSKDGKPLLSCAWPSSRTSSRTTSTRSSTSTSRGTANTTRSCSPGCRRSI